MAAQLLQRAPAGAAAGIANNGVRSATTAPQQRPSGRPGQLGSRQPEGSSSSSRNSRLERHASRATRRPVRCQAGGFSQPAGSADGVDASKLPNSREECIQQAASAIAAQLTSSGSGKGRGFDGAGGRKLTVDVPVLESGPVAAVALAQEIIAALPKPLAKQFTVVSCGDGALPSGGGGGARVLSLQQCVADGADLTGCLLITGPSAAQIDAVMRLLAYWRGPGAVVLNADWSAASAPPEQVAFLRTLESVYCFMPLMVKVLFIGQEGAVFKWCTAGNPAAAPWRIFGKEGNRLQPIGRMTTRPTNADLESAFYNAYAANNPLNRTIKAIRNPFGKK